MEARYLAATMGRSSHAHHSGEDDAEQQAHREQELGILLRRMPNVSQTRELLRIRRTGTPCP